jgi:SAM-dependent methyltransferase
MPSVTKHLSRPERVRAAIRGRHEISDAELDELYPAAHRYRSPVHWTPVDVALLAGEWLAGAPGGNVLDVGSGVGKACHVGALSTDVRWCGVERNGTMVRIANRVAGELAIAPRTTFVHGEALDLDWSAYGGIYMFNPFSEAACAPLPLDPAIRQAAYIHEVLAVERKLVTLYPGARVVTYYGFGGEMPAPFEMVDRRQVHNGFACLWIRREDASSSVSTPSGAPPTARVLRG